MSRQIKLYIEGLSLMVWVACILVYNVVDMKEIVAFLL